MKEKPIYPEIGFKREGNRVSLLTFCRVKADDGNYYLVAMRHDDLECADEQRLSALYNSINKSAYHFQTFGVIKDVSAGDGESKFYKLDKSQISEKERICGF